MKIRKMFYKNLMLILLLSIAVFLGGSGLVQAAVVINEICYDPSGADSTKEWIELYNNGGSSVDLTNWQIQWGGSTFATGTYTIPSGHTIAPSGYYLIGGSGVSAEFGVTPDLEKNFNFQNGGAESDGVRIWDGASYYDTVLYDSPNTNNLRGDDADPGAELCPDVAAGHSLSRKTPGVDNNLASDWEDLTSPTPQRGVDTKAPVMLRAVANDASGGGYGIQAGDQVVITFSECMTLLIITSANINSALPLSGGHSWLDGAVSIGGAAWSAGNSVLTITLSTGTSAPTVAAGDTIDPPGSGHLQDAATIPNHLDAPITITGSFGSSASAGSIVINEVAFKETKSRDWIELKVITSGNYDACRIIEEKTTIATIPNWGTLAAGDYIVIHINTSGTNDIVKSDNNPGWWDIYSSDTGLYGTDNIIQIMRPEGDDTRLAALLYSDNEGPGGWTRSNTEAQAIVTAGLWDTAANFSDPPDDDGDAWTDSDDVKAGNSIGRDSNSTNTNRKSDWYFSASSSQGKQNPGSLGSGVIIKINEVSFKADGGRDWVELYCVNDGNSGNGVDIGGCYFEDDGRIKTIAKGTRIKTGEYLVLQPAAGCLTVTFIDVGQGDTILVQTPKDKMILIDGGETNAGAIYVKSYLDREGIGKLHRIVATHPHADHVGGLAYILNTKTVEEVWDTHDYPDPGSVSAAYANFYDAVSDEPDCPYVNPTVGQTYTWDEDYNVTATVLNNYASAPYIGTEYMNNYSIVIKLTYGLVSFMLTGDIESSTLHSNDPRWGVEENLISGHGIGLTSDILKVAHHGSKNATSDNFLTYVYPDIGIISAGTSIHDHPRPATLTRLANHGVTYYCTDVDPDYSPPPAKPSSSGDITFFTNGMSYWMDELSAGDGIVNIRAHDTGLTGTDEQVIFKDALGNIEDAVCWSDGVLPSDEQKDLTAVYTAEEWIGNSASDCIDSTAVSDNYSIARNSISSDANRKEDWSPCSSPTRGKRNDADMPSGVGIRGVGVSEDPFLSDGSDLNRRYTRVSFTLNKEAEVTAQVLDGRGRIVRTLGEDKYFIADSHSFKWDGKNRSGDSVPIGTYIIYIKAVAEDGSSAEATTTVTVAKSLSGGGSGGCFIATAAYSSGTDSHRFITDGHRSQIVTLQDFRDNYLLTNPLGRAFVSTYYKVSPPIADFIRDKESLKAIVRTYLRPMVWGAKRVLK